MDPSHAPSGTRRGQVELSGLGVLRNSRVSGSSIEVDRSAMTLENFDSARHLNAFLDEQVIIRVVPDYPLFPIQQLKYHCCDE